MGLFRKYIPNIFFLETIIILISIRVELGLIVSTMCIVVKTDRDRQKETQVTNRIQF